MNQEFIEALSALCKEKGIDKEVLIEAIETALITAYKRDYGQDQEVRVIVDRVSGAMRVLRQQTVVEEVENADTEMSLEEARTLKKGYALGDVVETDVTPRTFGRIAAQTAKQIVVQRIREAERGVIYDAYIERENEVMNAMVHRVEKRNVFMDLGRTEAFMNASETMPNETYNPGDHMRVYVLEVKRTTTGPQVLVSRTHPGLVRRLFEMEVPEIQGGIVQIKSVAREAGFRTKMAVHSLDEDVDPVGACVGQKGIRVERIVEELKGEKIDIVRWSADPVEFIANALSPARVLMVQADDQIKAARVMVPDSQLSLAIGREGQNARLAAKLTGWKIDIKSQSQIEQMQQELYDYDAPIDELPNDYID
nr:transcription termination factor NusA [Maliibacterium massiliense]